MGKSALFDGRPPGMPSLGAYDVILGIQETVILQVGACGLAEAGDIAFGDKGDQMHEADRPRLHAGLDGGCEAQHDIGLVFPETHDIGDVADMQIDLWVQLRKLWSIGTTKRPAMASVELKRTVPASSSAFGAQIARERGKPLIECDQRFDKFSARSVRTMPFLKETRSCEPTMLWSRWMERLTLGWLVFSMLAARLKDFDFATARKVLNSSQ